MSEFHNPNLSHSFSISKSKKPLIPIEMQQHIAKSMRNKKLKTKGLSRHNVPVFQKPNLDEKMITPFFFKEVDRDQEEPFRFDTSSMSKELLTSPLSFAFDKRILKVCESSEPTPDPFMRHVIYLTPDTLAEAFDLLNRVSAARHLFDANISAEVKEDQEKSLWYLEVVV